MTFCSGSALYYLRDGTWGDTGLNAGGKARSDWDQMLDRMGARGFEPVAPDGKAVTSDSLGKIRGYLQSAGAIDAALGEVPAGAVVFVQFPLVCHTPLFARIMRRHRARDIRFVLVLHDVEMLRFGRSDDVALAARARIRLEERTALRVADCIIAHNDAMAGLLTSRVGVSRERIVSLGIFDYLAEGDMWGDACSRRRRTDAIVVAGNLSPHKAGYLYSDLDGLSLRLYGSGYAASPSTSVDYRGSFPPEELLDEMSGGFGLVWDGPSASTCAGAFGEYLRVNNPHKTSLYLAAGMPVIIWDEAALSSFITGNGVGFAVSRLADIPDAVASLSDGEYGDMVRRAAALGNRLRSGIYSHDAVEKTLSLLRALNE